MRVVTALALCLSALGVVGCSEEPDTAASEPSSAGSGGAGATSVSGAGAPLTSAGTNQSGDGAGVGGAAGVGGNLGAAGSSGAAGSAGQGGSTVVVEPGPIKHRVMAIEYPGRLVEISAEGEKLWEHQTPSLAVMFTVLPNGHVFFPHGGAKRGAQEVDRDHNVVWSYDSPAGELLGGERLANGNSLLGEGGPAQALELTPDKQVARTVPVMTTEPTAHGQIRHLHRLDNGNVLFSLEGEGAVREVDASGAKVWEYKGVSKIHEAIRLPSGNTLIGGGDSKRVLEVTPAGEIAWEFNASDAPELGLAWIGSVQVLKNGDLLVCNWVGADGGSGVHAFQVTRDKKVVWKLDDHELLKSATTVTALDD
jgi:hypothetical protein